MTKNIITINCNSLKDWHDWLVENHLKESSVGIIINKKHTGKGTISHLDSMKEAICFGWIDTTLKRIDGDRYVRYFRRRTDKSKWSENTLRYAKELLIEKRMSPEGLKRYNEGLSKPTHDHGIPKNPNLPSDIRIQLDNLGLLNQFRKLSKSARKMHLRYIIKSKLVETRQKRIDQLINLLKSRSG